MIVQKILTNYTRTLSSLLQVSGGACNGCMNSVRWKADDRRELIDSTPRRDMGNQGERGADIDLISRSKDDMFPDHLTPSRVFNGIKFDDLPVCYIKATKNNTIMLTTKAHTHKHLALRSCGMEGFKTARKGTNIAAQATAITHANMLKEKGVETVRVVVQGLGPGRISSIKGLQMAGMSIVSVTDATRVSYNPPRAKKQRKL